MDNEVLPLNLVGLQVVQNESHLVADMVVLPYPDLAKSLIMSYHNVELKGNWLCVN